MVTSGQCYSVSALKEAAACCLKSAGVRHAENIVKTLGLKRLVEQAFLVVPMAENSKPQSSELLRRALTDYYEHGQFMLCSGTKRLGAND